MKRVWVGGLFDGNGWEGLMTEASSPPRDLAMYLAYSFMRTMPRSSDPGASSYYYFCPNYSPRMRMPSVVNAPPCGCAEGDDVGKPNHHEPGSTRQCRQ
jgi:hypothetical protein